MANNFPNSKTVERLRKRYPEGCRVKLIQMDDIQAPPAGTCGTVSYVDALAAYMSTGIPEVHWLLYMALIHA